jgi:hypothetical protein
MTRRTTLAADRDDLALLEGEARRRGVSLAQVLRELVAREADALRQSRRPRFGVFESGVGDASERASDDEESPARGRLRS